MKHKRLNGESIIDYKVRLVENKDLYALDWRGIADLINEETGNKFGESSYRKHMSAFVDGINYQIEKSIDKEDNEIVNEIDEKTRELKKERVKLQTEKLEYNKWIRENARNEMFEDKIVEAIDRLEKLDVPKVIVGSDDGNKEGVLTIADIHFGRSSEVYGLNGELINEYNEEVFEKRMWVLLDETIEIIRKEELTKINLFVLGDILDGMNRISTLKSLQYGVTEATIKVSDFLAIWIAELSKYAKVDVYNNLDNHSEIRPLGSKSGEFDKESFIYIIVFYLKKRLENNSNVKVYDAQNINYVDILGTKIASVHGHNDKNLEKSIKDYCLFYGKRIDILLGAHYHSGASKVIGANELGNIEWIQNPSIAGTDSYAKKLKKISKAGSKLLIIEEGKGKTITYDITLL